MGGPGGARASSAVVHVVLLLCAFQFARWGFEALAFSAVAHTMLTNELVRMVSYLVSFGVLLGLARRFGIRLHLLPARLGPGYAAGLVLFAALFLATPFITGQAGDPVAWAALACGSIATPLFEEALFRGYVWERLRAAFAPGLPAGTAGGPAPHLGPARPIRQFGVRGWLLVAGVAVLFGLWHLGYVDAVAWRIAQPDAAPLPSDGLAGIMCGKVVFGAGMGMVLGALRLKWGTCLAPAIFHAVWNTLA